MRETDLYPPVKRYLAGQGYVVKSEIHHCDLVAVRGGEPPIVVELKAGFSLEVLFQAIDRQAITDSVYIAVPAPRSGSRAALVARHRTSILRLCRRLGLGLLLVEPKGERGRVEALLDPAPYRPRKSNRRGELLLKEFAQRIGDHNQGGSSRRPLVTAYRQDALRCASVVHARGAAGVAEIRREAHVARAACLLQRDVYGWFLRLERGVYGLSPKGQAAVIEFGDVIAGL